MIETVEDLIKQLIEAGRKVIDDTHISHRTTIGDMYEGLTKGVLEKALFKGLNLKVITSSFIENTKGELSHEMDVLLIEGEGRALPYVTNKYKVSENQVIAVLQVKKTLNKKLLADAYFNLKNVYDICELERSPDYARKMLSDAFRGVFKQGIHKSKPITKYLQSTTEEHVWHTIKAESHMPLRIIVGYQGYTKEASLRESFFEFLKEQRMVSGFSPLFFPDLIINDQLSLIKCNGMPYVARIEENSWPFYNSSVNKPIIHLLELIWTRLSYRYNLNPDIFGDDLENEGLNRFLSCNFVNVEGRQGWNYHYDSFKKGTFDQPIPSEDWEPVKLSIEQHHVIAYLCKYNFLRLTKINWCLSAIGKQLEPDLFVSNLIKTGLVYVDSHKELRLLTDNCRCLAYPGIGFIAADDKTGKFTRWVEKKSGKKIENVMNLTF